MTSMPLQTLSSIESTLTIKDSGGLLKNRVTGIFSRLFSMIFVAAAAPLAWIPQHFFLYFFISSFYFGVGFISPHGLSVNAADIAFFILAFAFFSFLLNPSGDLPQLNGNSIMVLSSVLLFTLWCCFSMLINLFSSSLDTTFRSLWFALRLAQLPLALYIFSSKGANRYRGCILDTIIFFSTFEIALALFQHFVLHEKTSRGTFIEHHAMLGIMMAPAAAISLYRFLIKKTYLPKVIYGTVFSLSIYCMILSQCRSMLVGVGIAILFFFLRNIKFNVRFFIYLACTIGAVAIAVKVTPLGEVAYRTIHSTDMHSSLELSTSLDLSSFGRLMIWKAVETHFLNAPFVEKLVGLGMGSFSTIHFNFFIFAQKGASGAHNNFLQALIETGIIGVIIFIFLFYSICRALLRLSKTDPLALTFFYATIALLASGFTQETFWLQTHFNGGFWLLNMVILGLILGNQRKEPVVSLLGKQLPELMEQ